MSRVIFYTPAYNAEKTMSRAVESVLAQTYTDFVYYLLDNASTDRTKEIIEEYGARDHRIFPLYNEKNWSGNMFMDIIEGHSDDSYFCLLDADDEYVPDFLEKMLSFITENRLDVATCGTNWIDCDTGKIIRRKVPEHNIILEGLEFADKFSLYRNYMVTFWGGLFSLKVLRRCNYKWCLNLMNFTDTGICMELFHRAERAGVFAESLHKYFVLSPSGTYSSRYNPEWLQASKNLMRITREYLQDYGSISRQNEDYLCVLHLILIKYILPRIKSSDVGLTEKLKNIYTILADDMTQNIFRHWTEVGINSDREEFKREISDWIASQDNDEKHRPIINDIIAALNCGGRMGQ